MIEKKIIHHKFHHHMKINLKPGMRALGIAECFLKKKNKSLLAGVIMRADFQIDGFSFSFCTVGGLDATDAVLSLIKRLKRPDINTVLISGTVIALYNVIDLNKIFYEVKKPIISISYEPSLGIEHYLAKLPDGQKRLEILRKNGPRIKVFLKNGLDVYIRPVGIDVSTALSILNKFTISGRYPEPIRVAKLLARSLYHFFLELNFI